ncbi:MAG: hypothetical protein KAJ39_01280 [Gammaproteobacteria bacterium]|nr:hypothetical protein [Gammaproteobacteria bacterium]
MAKHDSAELINALQFYITKAFDNEALFLHRFTNFDEVKNIELDECYMASERTRIKIILADGKEAVFTIGTNDFIDFCDAL